MEPMALGSPLSSPASSSHTSQFLPQYLLGENEMNGGVQALNPGLSQSHGGTSSARQLVMSPTSPARGKRVSFIGTLSPAPGSSDARVNRGPTSSGLLTQSEKGSGPPTTGLFDTLRPSTQPPQILSPVNPLESSLYESNLNASLLATSPISSTQPRWSSGEILTSNWVTVFGFPPSSTSSILAQFARYGNIIDKQLPVQGNWMYLQYQTRVEVRRALGNNGKVFGGNTMIGVVPCTDPAIVGDMCKENVNSPWDPNTSRLRAGNSSFGTPVLGSPNPVFVSPMGTPRSGRPLQKAFSSAHVGSEVVSPQHTPQRSSSFVSRAMDYVFNW